MLPAVTTSRRRAAIAAITALAIALPSAPAFAFNQREQDVLKGVAAVLLFQGLAKGAQQPQYAAPQAEPVYVPQYQPQYQPRATHSVYRTPAAQAFNTYAPSERRMIQRRLSRLGYYRGGVDGSFGPGTYSAVAAYAQDQGQGRALNSAQAVYAVYDGLIF